MSYGGPPVNEDTRWVSALTPVDFLGQRFKLTLYFQQQTLESEPILTEVAFERIADEHQLDKCEGDFQNLLTAVESNYGALSPVFPEGRDDRNKIVHSSVVWKQLKQGVSTYDIRTLLVSGSPWIDFQAERAGVMQINVEAFLAEENIETPVACRLSVGISQFPPTAPPRHSFWE